MHGRAVPAATAIKLMRPELTVMVTTGDGDCYGEGGNHFLHAVRRDPDITVIVHDNEVYALTKGQASPTTERGAKTRLQFDGVTDEPLNPLALSLVAGCRFVARGYAGDIAHLADIIVEGARHGGLAVIDVIQPCITWGKKLSHYYKDKIYRVGAEHDRSDFDAALKLSRTPSEKIPIGIFYKKENAASDLSRSSGETAGKETAKPTLSGNARETLAELLKDFE
ncbi:MAG: thiamine pyrophosphate-dependent enzyme [Endomicrobiia bacterium]|nr:thiamine pyrophosphate-dependent enzyme [Endomicrobiia bacterium]